jgi:hypothetical protein
MNDLVSDRGFVAAREGSYTIRSTQGGANAIGRDITLPFGVVFDVKNKPANYDDLPREVQQSLIDVVRIQAGRYAGESSTNPDESSLPPTEIEITKDDIKIRTLGNRPLRMVAPQIIFQERDDSSVLYRMRPTPQSMEFAYCNTDTGFNPGLVWKKVYMNDVNQVSKVEMRDGSVNFSFFLKGEPATAQIKVVNNEDPNVGPPALSFFWSNGTQQFPMDIAMDAETVWRDISLNDFVAGVGDQVGTGTIEDPFNYMEMKDAENRYRFLPKPYFDGEVDRVYLAIVMKRDGVSDWEPASLSLG